MTALAVIAILAIIVLLWAIATYNGLVRLFNLRDEAWSGVDVQLRRRFDLVPNLVETVKGYSIHEQNTLQKVTEARSAIAGASTPGTRIDAENALTSTLHSLFAVSEACPELKANTNFLRLQSELSSLENDLQLARRYYNGAVRNFNSAIQVFPAVLVSRRLGYSPSPFFQTDSESKAPVQVKFQEEKN
ncbi:MAG: LemA family protein [Synergistaceae bacterium]|jgi:LemA protein|nr:LemA family protein [Synergistaceae bacterium]